MLKGLLILAFEFFKTGLFAVGGGLATFPFLKAMAQRYPWFTWMELLDMVAISESTPGPIGVNMATFAGFNAYGVVGGLVATTALIFPSVVIVIAVSRFMERFAETPIVQNAFYGIRPATMGLIAGAMFDVFIMSFFKLNPAASGYDIIGIKPIPVLMFFVFLFGITRWKQIHPIVYIGIGALLGIVFKL